MALHHLDFQSYSRRYNLEFSKVRKSRSGSPNPYRIDPHPRNSWIDSLIPRKIESCTDTRLRRIPHGAIIRYSTRLFSNHEGMRGSRRSKRTSFLSIPKFSEQCYSTVWKSRVPFSRSSGAHLVGSFHNDSIARTNRKLLLPLNLTLDGRQQTRRGDKNWTWRNSFDNYASTFQC